jgi:hypothetical protein
LQSKNRVLFEKAEKRKKKRKHLDGYMMTEEKVPKLDDPSTDLPTPTKKRGFYWATYLDAEKAIPAPLKLFKEVIFRLFSQTRIIVITFLH